MPEAQDKEGHIMTRNNLYPVVTSFMLPHDIRSP